VLGAQGVGEIGTNGVPAAIGNAIFNATEKPIRRIPITPDHVLMA
jgi:xanthine dehydrogenase YagR molybdenum-binding subunit